jgi:hypothetical protein
MQERDVSERTPEHDMPLKHGINFEAWARNAVAFIREKGLEHEFRDWSGGWPCPVGATATMLAKAPAMYEALEKIANGDGVYGAQAHEYKQIARAALAASPSGRET